MPFLGSRAGLGTCCHGLHCGGLPQGNKDDCYSGRPRSQEHRCTRRLRRCCDGRVVLAMARLRMLDGHLALTADTAFISIQCAWCTRHVHAAATVRATHHRLAHWSHQLSRQDRRVKCSELIIPSAGTTVASSLQSSRCQGRVNDVSARTTPMGRPMATPSAGRAPVLCTWCRVQIWGQHKQTDRCHPPAHSGAHMQSPHLDSRSRPASVPTDHWACMKAMERLVFNVMHCHGRSATQPSSPSGSQSVSMIAKFH